MLINFFSKLYRRFIFRKLPKDLRNLLVGSPLTTKEILDILSTFKSKSSSTQQLACMAGIMTCVPDDFTRHTRVIAFCPCLLPFKSTMLTYDGMKLTGCAYLHEVKKMLDLYNKYERENYNVKRTKKSS